MSNPRTRTRTRRKRHDDDRAYYTGAAKICEEIGRRCRALEAVPLLVPDHRLRAVETAHLQDLSYADPNITPYANALNELQD